MLTPGEQRDVDLFTYEDDKAILKVCLILKVFISYILFQYLKRYGGYSRRAGKLFWQEMERKGILEGRTWLSLKSRFNKHILPNLAKFKPKVTEAQLIEEDEKAKGAMRAAIGRA